MLMSSTTYSGDFGVSPYTGNKITEKIVISSGSSKSSSVRKSSSSSSSSSKSSSKKIEPESVKSVDDLNKYLQSISTMSLSDLKKEQDKIVKLETQSNKSSSSSSKSLRNPTPVNNAETKVKEEIKQSGYEKVDSFLGGWLPGGVSPTSVKDQSLRAKTEEKESLNEAQLKAQVQTYDYKLQKEKNEREFEAQLQAIKDQQDLVTKNWYEKIGLFSSDQEKAFQEAVSRQQAYDLMTAQIPNTATSFDAYNQALANNPSFNDAVSVPLSANESIFDKIGSGLKTTSNYALAIGGVVLGVLLLSRGKK